MGNSHQSMKNSTSVHNQTLWHLNITLCHGPNVTNGTNSTLFGDVRVDQEKILSPATYVLDLAALMTGYVGVSMCCTIFKYLSNKAGGEQSEMDIPLKTLFVALGATDVHQALTVIISSALQDSGHLIGITVSWIMFNLILVLMMMVMAVSLLQLIKLFHPGFTFPITDKSMTIGFNLIVATLMLGITCFGIGFNMPPTTYFLIRGMPLPENCLEITDITSAGFTSTMILYFSTRIIIYFWTGDAKSGDLIGWKIFFISCIPIFVYIFIKNVLKIGFFSLHAMSVIMVASLFPILVIVNNEKLCSYTKRHNSLYHCTTALLNYLLGKLRTNRVSAQSGIELRELNSVV